MKRRHAYLDTANWIDLAQGNVDDGPLRQAVDERRILPVLSHNHIIELAQQPNEKRSLEVAAYLDGFKRSLIWIRNIDTTVTREVAAEAQRAITGKAQAVVPFVLRPSLAFGHQLSPNDEIFIDKLRILDMVAHSRSVPMGTYNSERNTQPTRRRVVRAQRRHAGRLRIGSDEHERWILGNLPDRIIGHNGVIVSATDHRDVILSNFDISRCPALLTDIAYQDGRNVATDTPRPSDMEDLAHLVGVAYCAFSFADRATVAALRQGKAPIIPMRNGQLSDWLMSLRSGEESL